MRDVAKLMVEEWMKVMKGKAQMKVVWRGLLRIIEEAQLMSLGGNIVSDFNGAVEGRW